MRVVLSGCEVRSWSEADVVSVAQHANNRAIWRNLRDRFPHPYQESDARTYITRAREQTPESNFAISVDGAAVGSVALMLGTDVERFSAEIGYWLGETYWRRGITSQCVGAVTAHAFTELGLKRVFALPFAGNGASCRVLEKAGFTLEARLRKSAFKEGRVTDQFLYACVASE